MDEMGIEQVDVAFEISPHITNAANSTVRWTHIATTCHDKHSNDDVLILADVCHADNVTFHHNSVEIIRRKQQQDIFWPRLRSILNPVRPFTHAFDDEPDIDDLPSSLIPTLTNSSFNGKTKILCSADADTRVPIKKLNYTNGTIVTARHIYRGITMNPLDLISSKICPTWAFCYTYRNQGCLDPV